ncbi:transcriptional regulator SplA domain-containing protein [Salirhabdus salicampi]|uniref:transcriptional regulator SplA domain-containing protein n=1 Tax=Salirhabdus salicampi TaxID=476102 RepID=UPI0020C21B43|nr:transcriptional regulator SplA domain-containing protein [Salirhabdus salicampi]MCP8616043.1 transcriptional regulator SplA [Salirhabdus salicampi]
MDVHEAYDQQYEPGDIVYVIYRNPHIQNVANIQEAAIVQNPDHEEEISLFLYETYYPVSDELAIFKTKEEALEAYETYFGDLEGANELW